MAKVLVSLGDDLLRQIDRAARSRGLSRSGYLAQLAARDVARGGPGTTATARRALLRLDRVLGSAPPGDSTGAIRDERDAR